jgi:hypothetical protein
MDRNMRRLGSAVALALGLACEPMGTAAQTLERATVRHGSVDVPVEIARPEVAAPGRRCFTSTPSEASRMSTASMCARWRATASG